MHSCFKKEYRGKSAVKAAIKAFEWIWANTSYTKIVGTVKEDAGLSNIAVGDPVTFTLDAWKGKNFTGIVEEISPTSKDSSIVFNISDKREVKDFTIKVKYDVSAHSEFKNGMSAKIKVFFKK